MPETTNTEETRIHDDYIQKNATIINSIKLPNYKQIKENLLSVANFCGSKEALKNLFDKLSDEAVIEITKTFTNKTISGSQARAYLKQTLNRDSLEEFILRLNEEFLIEPVSTNEMNAIQTARLTPVQETFGEKIMRIFNRLRRH